MRATLRELKEELRRRINRPIPETGKWLASVVSGYFADHAVPTNGPALAAFRNHVTVLWHRQLCRRSQRAHVLWTRMATLAHEYLPKPRILPSLAQRAVRRQTLEVGALCGNSARTDLSGGRSAMNVPTGNVSAHTGRRLRTATSDNPSVHDDRRDASMRRYRPHDGGG